MFCLHLVNFNTFLIERFIRCTHLGKSNKLVKKCAHAAQMKQERSQSEVERRNLILRN